MKRFALLALLTLAACTDSDGAKKAAEEMGFTDVATTGYRWFGCGDENFHTGFVAKRGALDVSGVVCSGWFKGSTVRLD